MLELINTLLIITILVLALYLIAILYIISFVYHQYTKYEYIKLLNFILISILCTEFIFVIILRKYIF